MSLEKSPMAKSAGGSAEKPKIGGPKTVEKPGEKKPGKKLRHISGSGASEDLGFEVRQRIDEVTGLTVEEIKKLAPDEINKIFSEINVFIEKEEESIRKLEREKDQSADAEKDMGEKIDAVNLYKEDLARIKESREKILKSVIEFADEKLQVKKFTGPGGETAFKSAVLDLGFKKEVANEVYDSFISGLEEFSYVKRAESVPAPIIESVSGLKTETKKAEEIKELNSEIINRINKITDVDFNMRREDNREMLSKLVKEKKDMIDFAIEKIKELPNAENLLKESFDLNDLKILSQYKYEAGAGISKVPEEMMEGYNNAVGRKKNFINRLASLGLREEAINDIYEKLAEGAIESSVRERIGEHELVETVSKKEEENKIEAKEKPEIIKLSDAILKEIREKSAEISEIHKVLLKTIKEEGNEELIKQLKEEAKEKYREIENLGKELEEAEKAEKLLKEPKEIGESIEEKPYQGGKEVKIEELKEVREKKEEKKEVEVKSRIKLREALREELKEVREVGDMSLILILEKEIKEAEAIEVKKIKIELDNTRKEFALIDPTNPKYSEIQGKYQKTVGEMRGFLYRMKKDTLEKSGLNPEEVEKELEKYTREIIIPHFAVVEAAEIQGLRTEQTLIEKTKDSRVAKFFYGIVDKYRKIPFKQKMYISGALIAGGMLVSGGAIAGIITGGVGLQRILGGAGTAVAAEALMQKSQKKWMEKEGWGKNRHEFVSKEIDKIRQLAKQKELKEERLERVGGMEETEKLLKERQELINKLEIRRTALAGMVGFLVGSGAAFQAVKQYGEWTGVTEVLKEKAKGIFSWFTGPVDIRGGGAAPQPHPAPEHLGVKAPEKIIPLTPHEAAPVAPAPSVEMPLTKLEIGARGPEGAMIDYFKGHPDVAKTFGWDGESDLKKWAGGAAHRLWLADADQALSKPDTLAELKRLGYPPNAEGYAQMMRRIGKGLVEIDPTNKNINLVDTEYLKNNIKELGKSVSEPIIHGDKVPVPEEIMPLEPIHGDKVPVPEEIMPSESELIHGEGMPEEIISQDSTMAKHLEEIAKESGGENIIKNAKSGIMGIFEYASDGKIKDVYVSGRVNPLEAQKLLNDNWRILVMEKFTNFDLQSRIIGTRAGAIYQYEQILETLKQQGKGSGPESEFIKNKIGMIKKLTEGKYGDVFK